MLTYDDALALIRREPLGGQAETVPLAEGMGRVLAGPVRLSRDVPAFDRATMDGFAVPVGSTHTRFRVVGTTHAGELAPRALQGDEAVRIMTGAPCPPAVAVVPHERTRTDGDGVVIDDRELFATRRNVAAQGEDGRAGDVIGHPGTRISPYTLSTLAMAGARDVSVWRSPRVSVVTTGDEVGQDGPAGVADSNGPLLSALIPAFGGAVHRSHAPDRADALLEVLRRAAANAEVVVTVGGVSAGAKDLVPEVSRHLGFETVFHKVSMQPGKPALVARHPDGGWFVGLPGNPVSVIATSHLILAPVLGRLLGGYEPQWLTLPAGEALDHRGDRHLFRPGVLTRHGVRLVPWNGSGDLIAAATADGLVDLRPGTSVSPGQPVRFLPFVGTSPSDRGRFPQSRAPHESEPS